MAAVVGVSPSADALLFAGEPNSNYGGAGQLAVSDAGRAEGEYQSLLRFDLAAAKAFFDSAIGPGQWMLESAELRLSTSNPNNAIFNANLSGPVSVSWLSDDSWIEGTGTPTSPASQGITFNTLSSVLGAQDQPLGVLSFPGGNSGANTYSLELSPGFIADASAGDLVSMRLFADAAATVSYNFSSRTFQNAASRPELRLNAVVIPEPAGLFGVAIAVGACARVWRRG